MLVLNLFGGSFAFGQGTFSPVVYNTTAGQSLISGQSAFSVANDVSNPLLELKFGFATDEVLQPGAFGDSFTLTIQDDLAFLTMVLVTVDPSGVVWAPPTPGATLLAESSILRMPIDYPSLTPSLNYQWAYDIKVALPQEAVGQPLTLYFDLFNNDNGIASQGWFADLNVVPEPATWGLLLAGGIGLLAFNQFDQRKLIRGHAAKALASEAKSDDESRFSRDGTSTHRRRGLSEKWLRFFIFFLLAAVVLLPLRADAQTEQAFHLNGGDITLQEASSDVSVYFSSMRLNRALNVWNVEVAVTNTSARVLAGPLVLLVDSFSGTTGIQLSDGATASGKQFLDLSGWSADASLAPGQGTGKRTLMLGRSGTSAPSLVTKFFVARPPKAAALGITRSLNDAGQPLPGVELDIAGPAGSTSQLSDSPSGVASFGQGPGEHIVKFVTDGYLPVWRKQDLTLDQTAVLPNPRLTKRSENTFVVSPLGGTQVTNATGSITIDFGSGIVNQSTTVTLTPLTGQNLPAFLPLGWSPLNAFWIEANSPFASPLAAKLKPTGAIRATELAALVRWNTNALQWTVEQTVPGNGTNVLNVSLGATGAYALVVADIGETAPPPAQVGAALQGYDLPAEIDAAGLTADGSVTPPASPASVIPALATGTANLKIQHATANLPSGYLLRGEVTESYLLSDGSLRLTPQYEQYIVGYQRPGDQDPQTLNASFPMRPVLLFGPDQLDEAAVRVDVLPQGTFDGIALDTNGGQIGADGIRVLAGSGQLTGPSALRLRRVDSTVFTNLMADGFEVVGAFDLTVDRSTVSGGLVPQLTGAPTNGLFVLARVLSDVGIYGLQPIERLQSDANGNLNSLEPTTGEALAGLRGSGQYVLVEVAQPQGLISGVARNGQGNVQAGMPVRLTGLPWLTLTDDQGRYQLVAPTGDVEVGVTDPTTGDTGFATANVADPMIPVGQDLGTAPAGPRVASISPTDGATQVARVLSVVIRFTEAVNPATVVGDAIQILKPDDSVVPASLTLDLKNTTATLSPATDLDSSTIYRVRLASTIADPTGMALEGSKEFSFTTVAPSTRITTAQLVIYEPGATNVPVEIQNEIPAFTPGDDPYAIVVHGQPGVADPAVPVVLVNEDSGETQTVLSKPDGSFSSFINGTEEDVISATFVNLNGTRVYVPVSRQEFDDGFVGLYSRGGDLQVQSDAGPVTISLPPNAIQGRTKFKIDPLNVLELQSQVGGVMPTNATVAGTALNLHVEGNPPTLPMQVRFPVDLTAAGYPTNEAPTNVTAALAVVRDTEDITTYEIRDQMLFTPRTNTPAPFKPGGAIRIQSGDSQQVADGFLDTSIGLVLPALGPAALPIQIGFNQVLVPLLFGPRPVVIKGKVAALPYDVALELQRAGVINSAVNLQTGNGSVDIPVYLAQTMGLVDLGFVVGQAQAFVSAAYTAMYQRALVISKPLSGAFVTVSLSGGPLNRQAGRLFPGMVYATSGADGYFLTVAPAAGANYVVTATHPRFQDTQTESANPLNFVPGQQGDLTLSGVVYKNFFFQVPSDTETPPTVSISTVPVQPAAGQPAQIIVNASQPVEAPDIKVKIVQMGRTNLLTGKVETNVVYSLDNANLAKIGTSSRWTGTLNVNRPVLAQLQVNVRGQNFFQDANIPYGVAFTGPQPPTPVPNIPAPDTNDVHGPLVVEVKPSNDGFVGEDGQIILFFNKPIDSYVTNHLEGITLSGSATDVAPIVRLSASQQSLSLQYPGLNPDGEYRLTLSGQSVRDLAGQPLDQLPSTDSAETFTTTFRTPPASSASLGGVVNGRGAAISGNRLYVVEQGPPADQLSIYDISTPLQPKFLNRVPLRGQPRDLVVVPHYDYKRSQHGQVQSNDLVVVVGGDLDAQINQVQGTTVSVKGQYLWVVAMEDNGKSPNVIASPIVTYRVSSVANKVRWAPPFLVYQEYGQDAQFLGFVNLQELLVGYGSSQAERDAFPTPQRRNATNTGKDLNGDGDYVDDGETLPIPDLAPPEFYGKKFNVVVENTTQKILDFSVDRGGSDVGVTLRNGFFLDEKGQPTGAIVPPMYRTLVYGGLPLNPTDPSSGVYPFKQNSYPRWVKLISKLPLEIGGVRTTISAALVSLQPDDDGIQTLAVLNITLPLSPKLVNKIAIPDTLLGGAIQSIDLGQDGSLEVAGTRNLLLLDPTQLAITNVPAGQLHPSIVGLVPDAGAGSRSLGTTDYGVHAIADGGRSMVIQSPPALAFVNFPGRSTLIDPTQLASMAETNVTAALATMRIASGLAPARVHNQPTLFLDSDLEPNPNTALHYYVLVTAPGSAGSTIELGLESLNPAGRPLSNPGAGFAPVRAVSGSAQDATGQRPRESCGAAIRSLTAWRMSDDPNSPYYNKYLSRPFALVTETVTSEELFRLTTEVDREIIFSGAELRAFIDPSEATQPDAAPVIGPFAAQIDARKKVIYPISTVTAFTVNRDYIVGDNPPPPGSPAPIEDTYGAILSHSGELRTSDVDLSVPSPRMPINIVRTIGNQDTYEGPFGVGWDFNYNQRLTVLDPLTFPQGLQLPLVVRDTEADSELAGSQDVLFNDGEGQIIHFRWMGTNMPALYQQDPLVQNFKYQEVVSDYYLPQRGVFNLLVKFKDGRFERLTPAGTRYRYASSGRLESIIDAYPENRHDLQYDRNGWLVRIDDHSVTVPRYLEIGHYRRRSSDPDFVSDLDENTENAYLEGLICRLRDFTGRDVLFQYDSQGFLTNRVGVEVQGANGGFAGRSQTFYTYVNCRLASISATADGTPYVAAANTFTESGKPVAQASSGSYGNADISISPDSSAKNIATKTSSVTVSDQTTVQRQYDNRGNVTKTTVAGPNTPAVSEVRSNTVDGLVYFVRHPEGNTETMNYDSGNSIFRSRGNLLSVTVDPGPRGGSSYTQSFHYDPRYNVMSGEQIDANGFHNVYSLTSDGRAIAKITYESGETRTSSYNTRGQATHTVNENGVERSMTYNDADGYIQTESSGGITYTYGYDGSRASLLGRPASIAPPLSAPTTFVYDDRMQATRIARGGLIQKFAYDEIGRATIEEQEVGDGRKLTTARSFNEKGFLTNVTISGVEVDGSVSSISTTMVPDKRSRVEKVIHPNGTEQTFEYDARGNNIKTDYGDYSEKFTYDLNNNLTAVTQGGDLVRTYEYDGLDRVRKMIRKTGTQDYTESSTYRPGGQMLTETLTDPVFGTVKEMNYGSIDALGRHLDVAVHGNVISPQYSYTYGSLMSGVTGPRMNSSTTWDASGNATSYKDPNTQVVMQRDANGRVFQTDSQEDGATYSRTFTFDDLDHQKTLSDPLGTVFTYDPRADGTFTKITNQRGNAATMDHSALGELLSKKRADGMEMEYRFNKERQMVYQGDPNAGFSYGYDNTMRLTNDTLRSGSARTYGGFDPRSMPTAITLPGGNETRKYDLQRRMIQRTLEYQGKTLLEDYTYDAMDRIRSVKYTQNGGSENTDSFDYDPAGPLVAAHFAEDGNQFDVSYGYYADGVEKSITYPSGVKVDEIRDATGRLTGLSDANGNIISASSWQGNSQPKVLQLGSTMQIVNQYDARGRLTGSRTTRTADDAVLAHMRYQYDGANNLQIRQYVHRGGRADVFGFDAGERIAQAQIGVLVTNVAGTGPTLYARHYSYEPLGLDYLTTAMITGAAANAPPFATNWTSHDSFLLPGIVDGYARGQADPLGNVASAQLWVRTAGAGSAQPVTASIEHDGLGRLVRIQFADGTIVKNQYQPGGLRFATEVIRGGSTIRNLAYVYDSSSRLIEEYDRTVTPAQLRARYYYASGDAPVAADLRAGGTGPLQRFYYLTDTSMSVIAIADADGNVVERTWYDTFGQPAIERRDTAAPTVNLIQAGDGGSLLVVFSEPVQPTWTDPGPGSGVVAFDHDLQSAVTLRDADSGSSIEGTVTWESAAPGYRPLSVIRFSPTQSATGAVTMTLVGGAVSDEWGNTNTTRSVTFTNSAPAGTVFYLGAPQTDTAAVPLARSALDSPFLFHGQYYDYDSGLVYLRARYYDAFSGMFLEPDPLGYESSVNHYAAYANNPVSQRDPSGLLPKGISYGAFRHYLANEHGFTSHELRLFDGAHEHLTRLGMGSIEIAAHVRVMYREAMENKRNWELGIRSFGTEEKAATRLARLDEFYQTKEEKVYAKTQDDGIAHHDIDGVLTGEQFTGDMDGLYAKLNGEIATIDQLTAFQNAVNAEAASLSKGYREMAEGGGGYIHQTEVQKVYQHGFSLNIPQEYGSKHALSDGGRFGYQAVENINKKMKKGIGEAFSIAFDSNNPNEIEINDKVDVDGMVQEHESFYKDVLFNPWAAGKGFNRELFNQRKRQMRRDAGRVHDTLFPKPFYMKNK